MEEQKKVVKHFKKLMSQANLSSSTRFHDLRRSFAVTSKMQKDSAERIQLFYEQLQMLDTLEKMQQGKKKRGKLLCRQYRKYLLHESVEKAKK